MANLLKQKPFSLTSLDRQALDPINGGYADIDWWYRLYFDGELFPWQQYFYHHPAKDKMVVAGIRTGKSFVAAVVILQLPCLSSLCSRVEHVHHLRIEDRVARRGGGLNPWRLHAEDHARRKALPNSAVRKHQVADALRCR